MYLICNCINSFVGMKKEKRNSQCEHGQQFKHKRLILHVKLRCGSLSITTPVPLLANEFDVRSVLHGQVSLAAVNQIDDFHEAIYERLQKSKDVLQACFEDINIR